MHDKLDGDVREAEILQARIKKVPINIIKSFLQIKLESHISFFLFGSSHVMKILQNNWVVRSSPTWQKTASVRANNIIKDRSETLNQHFCNDFVNNVAQTDGSKIFVSIVWINLRDKCNESVWNLRIKVVTPHFYLIIFSWCLSIFIWFYMTIFDIHDLDMILCEIYDLVWIVWYLVWW